MPILYSFRRCPFAIRARLALLNAEIEVELREVRLRDKPKSLFDVSPKGTVPVLIHEDLVIDESLDIIKWTLETTRWCKNANPNYDLVEENDTSFKSHLDQYKYAERHPEESQAEHRAKAAPFLAELNGRLSKTKYLAGESIGVEDIAILPFVRQFANVDRLWFDKTDQHHIQRWISHWEGSQLFRKSMTKYPPWKPFEDTLWFPLIESLLGSETQTHRCIQTILESNITITPALLRSLETAPPKSLSILLIRVFRAAGLSANPERQLYNELKTQLRRETSNTDTQ